MPLLSKQDDRSFEQDAKQYVLFVWEDCFESVEVFKLCTIDAIAAGFGIYWIGVSSLQIKSACALLGFARKHWAQIAEDVTFMGKEVAEARNTKKR